MIHRQIPHPLNQSAVHTQYPSFQSIMQLKEGRLLCLPIVSSGSLLIHASVPIQVLIMVLMPAWPEHEKHFPLNVTSSGYKINISHGNLEIIAGLLLQNKVQ